MTEARLSDAPDRFAEGTPERLKHDVFVREKVIEHLQTEIAGLKAASEQDAQQIAALTQERDALAVRLHVRTEADRAWQANTALRASEAEARLTALQGALRLLAETWEAAAYGCDDGSGVTASALRAHQFRNRATEVRALLSVPQEPNTEKETA